MSARSVQSRLSSVDVDATTVDRDDDGHLRGCPVCGAEWPDWQPEDGRNPLVEHLDDVGPEHFGLTPLRSGEQ